MKNLIALIFILLISCTKTEKDESQYIVKENIVIDSKSDNYYSGYWVGYMNAKAKFESDSTLWLDGYRKGLKVNFGGLKDSIKIAYYPIREDFTITIVNKANCDIDLWDLLGLNKEDCRNMVLTGFNIKTINDTN